MKYHIYSHADADGGIAAAIFSKFLLQKYKAIQHISVSGVQHVPFAGKPEWPLQEIHWPCAILDFTLHPTLLSQRFHPKETEGVDCYWIDHHPTGSFYPFLTEANASSLVPYVKILWDTKATSTPGLLRTHRKELGIPDSILKTYEEFIDLAEIIDGALFSSCEATFDFEDPAVKLQTLFYATHPAIDPQHFYRYLVDGIQRYPKVEEFLSHDSLFQGVIDYEKKLHEGRLSIYTKHTERKGNIAIADLTKEPHYHSGLGRFIPYLLFPDVLYAIHLIPKKTDEISIACGINPWKLKKEDNRKDLGPYFREHFQGGGHKFVAGGKFSPKDMKKIKDLIDYLNKD